jgi:Saxitoxin biosynthesis operon protein SxtJ
MALIKINDNPTTRELRQFAGIWFPVFWLIVAAVLARSGSPRAAITAAVVGIVVGAIGLARPRFIHPIYLIWMYLAYPIGFVVSHLLLGVIFYLVLTPVGLLMKIFGYDPLQRRLGTAATYWVRAEPATNKNQYFRQF